MERIDAETLDDVVWHRLLQTSGGAAAACFQCGVCTATCPWGLVREEALRVRHLMREAQLGRLGASEAAWLCTACGECEQVCPRQVPVADVFRSLRGLMWERREVPEGLPSVLWSMHWNRNPWSQPPSQRMRWAEGLHLPAFDPKEHEILLYIGCTAAYLPRAQKIARSVVRVLRTAGVPFGVLGVDEPCCGEAALSLGHAAYFDDLAAATSAFLDQRGARTLVTISPHAFDVFANHYPSETRSFEPVHYVSYLAGLVESGRLKPGETAPRKVTYHDPCLLGRRGRDVESARTILRSIPGLSLVEMEHNRSQATCCGGGGGRMWLETPRGERFADLRLREAEATGADVLATACPFCVFMLEDSLRERAVRGLHVLDIAEVLDLAGVRA